MKKRQKIKVKFGLEFLMVAAFVLAITSPQAWALVDCSALSPSDVADSDSDGFSDFQECSGIEVYHSDTRIFLNPDQQDLFVILVYATDLGFPKTNIPENPLEFVSNPITAGGLELTTHLIPFDKSNLDRFVSPNPSITQKAVRITEDLDPNGIVLGVANQGTPNGLDEASVFTERIKNHVNTTCLEGTEYCRDSVTSATGLGLINLYIKHTIAHEIGHMTMLAVDYNRRFGGYHYKAGSEVILEQAVKYTSKQGKVTFYISTKYAEPSQQALQLH